jgi:hypothetical protein
MFVEIWKTEEGFKFDELEIRLAVNIDFIFEKLEKLSQRPYGWIHLMFFKMKINEEIRKLIKKLHKEESLSN